LCKCDCGRETVKVAGDLLRKTKMSTSSCGNCQNRVNGIAISSQQQKIARMTDGELNYITGSGLSIDVTLPDKIAIEYDSWYWHAHKQNKDAEKSRKLLSEGWRLLRIKSNTMIPDWETLSREIKLLGGTNYRELVLTDWGIGKTVVDIGTPL
jgi:hypothetical protein